MSWLFEVDTRFNIAGEFVGWKLGAEELFLLFKILFCLTLEIQNPFLVVVVVVVVAYCEVNSGKIEGML